MSEPAADDRPSRIAWPPIIYGVAIITVVILERLLPFWPIPGHWLRGVGYVAVVAGLAIGGAGFAYFQHVGTTVNPTGPASELAEDGIYRFTRNPMYLGALVFFAGLAVALQSAWLLLAVPAMLVALVRLAIEPEEAYLTRRFGADYERYCLRVRRWV